MYDSLDEEFQLPNLLNWSAVKYEHSVILFGGRSANEYKEFSNRLFTVQLRPEFEDSLRLVRAKREELDKVLARELKKWPEQPKTRELKNASMSQLPSLNFKNETPKKLVDDVSIRIMSLNVHGWRDPPGKRLIDESVMEMISSYSPEFICLQEVKHPFPYNPGNHVVRLGKNKTLLRYSDEESAEQILHRISNPDDEIKNFFRNSEIRNASIYLQKVSETKLIKTRSTDTVLSKISKFAIGKGFLFSPALDCTFGNAIIYKKNIISEKKFEILIDSSNEKRSICGVTIKLPSNLEVAVFTLHLDEKSEKNREKQFRKILEWMEKEDDINYIPHILCGDFNMLSQWNEKIANTRKRNNFEEPKNDLYHLICNDFKYEDLEVKKPPRPTCHYDTRVDYFFASEALLPRLSHYNLNVVPSDSDHRALLTNLNINQRKIVIGISGSSESVRSRVTKQVIHHLKSSEDLPSFQLVSEKEFICETNNQVNYSQCFSKLCNTLSEKDLIILEGQCGKKLVHSLNWLFDISANLPREIRNSALRNCDRFDVIEERNAVKVIITKIFELFGM